MAEIEKYMGNSIDDFIIDDEQHEYEIDELKFKYIASTAIYWLKIDLLIGVSSSLFALCIFVFGINRFDQSNILTLGVFLSLVSGVYFFQIVADLEFRIKARALSHVLKKEISDRRLI